METPERGIDREPADARGGSGRDKPRHDDDRVVESHPLHLCLMVCDPRKVRAAPGPCQANKPRMRLHAPDEVADDLDDRDNFSKDDLTRVGGQCLRLHSDPGPPTLTDDIGVGRSRALSRRGPPGEGPAIGVRCGPGAHRTPTVPRCRRHRNGARRRGRGQA